ncbi:MAG: hypothetical protein PUC65_14365 [Clostridiales bacterium]|nr:hypothetical protein [Clostridiales bacterium]
MEKYIKSLSITLMILTGVWFLSLIGGTYGDAIHMPGFITNILVTGANVLIFVIPLVYIAVFGISMVSIFKRVMNAQVTMWKDKFAKFPAVWLVLAMICFMIFMTFINMLLATD